MADPRDVAFGGGQKACWEGKPRLANPYENQKLKRLWYGGYDSAQRAKALQNTKAIGKF